MVRNIYKRYFVHLAQGISTRTKSGLNPFQWNLWKSQFQLRDCTWTGTFVFPKFVVRKLTKNISTVYWRGSIKTTVVTLLSWQMKALKFTWKLCNNCGVWIQDFQVYIYLFYTGSRNFESGFFVAKEERWMSAWRWRAAVWCWALNFETRFLFIF